MAEDGLNWILNLDADLGGAVKISSVLDNLDKTLNSVDAHLNRVESASHAAGDAHKKQGQEVHKATGFIKAMEQAFKPLEEHFKKVGEFELFRKATDALIELPFKIADGVRELGEEMLITAAKAERTNKAFSLVFGPEIGKENLEYIEKIGKFTEFTRDELKGAALDLAKVGFKGAGLDRALAASLDIAAFSKSGGEGQQNALGALERIKNTGRVDRRTLMPLGIGEADFFKELTLRTGIGAKELKKKMEAGTLDAEKSLETLYTMITRRTHKDLGGAGVEMGNTLMARLAHLKEVPELLFEKMADLPAFAKISDLIGRAAEALNPEGGAGSKLFEALASAFTRVGNAVTAVDWPDVANNIAKIIDVIGTFVAGGIAFTDQLLRGFGRVIDIFMGSPEALNAALASIGDNLLNATLWLGKKMSDLGSALWMGLLDGIAGGVTKVLDAVGNLGESVVLKLKGVLGIHSPSRVFEGLGEMTGKGFQRGVESSMANAYDAIPDPPADRFTYARSGVDAVSGGATSVAMGGVTVNLLLQSTGINEKDAEEITHRLAQILPSTLEAAFADLRGHVGA